MNLLSKSIAPVAVVLGLATTPTANAAVLPPFFLSAVVAIGHTENVVGGTRWFTEGSGFFYGFLAQSDPDPAKRRYEIYLVTNRHVVANKATVRSD